MTCITRNTELPSLSCLMQTWKELRRLQSLVYSFINVSTNSSTLLNIAKVALVDTTLLNGKNLLPTAAKVSHKDISRKLIKTKAHSTKQFSSQQDVQIFSIKSPQPSMRAAHRWRLLPAYSLTWFSASLVEPFQAFPAFILQMSFRDI